MAYNSSLQTNAIIGQHNLTCTDLRHFCFSTLVDPTSGSLPGSAVMRLSTCRPHTSSAAKDYIAPHKLLRRTSWPTQAILQPARLATLPLELPATTFSNGVVKELHTPLCSTKAVMQVLCKPSCCCRQPALPSCCSQPALPCCYWQACLAL